MPQENLRTATKEVANLKAQSDVNAIKEDLSALRDDAARLIRHSKESGKEQIAVAEEKAKKFYAQGKTAARDYYGEVETYVRTNPGQSLAVAFIGGVVASMLFGRRS